MEDQETVEMEEYEKNPLLTAAKKGDDSKLKLLLEQTVTDEPYTDLEDLTYQFQDLLKCDPQGRTCLHLAATVGNHERAFLCTEILLTSIQVIFPEEEYETKLKQLIDFKDENNETALHLAISNKATSVVTYLIENNAGVSFKSKEGIDALSLIYQKIPEALSPIYDHSIKLNKDFKKFCLDFGPIIGYVNTLKEDPTDNGIQAIRSNDFRHSAYLEHGRKETENLSLILKIDGWAGANLLKHPLIKIFLHLKWKKIQLFFYMSFFYHTCWLLLYAAVFVDLNCIVGSENETAKHVESQDKEEATIGRLRYSLWCILLPLTSLMALKEIYQFYQWMTARQKFFSFENCVQTLFIVCYFTQFGLLLNRHFELVASISVVGILLCTLLMICQLGKTPYFGMQVAALTRVVYSCKPHMFLFIVWFFGFGLAFWALFYKTEAFSIYRMPAIITGMAIGELNLNELMPKLDAKSLTVQIFSVLCLILFIVIIVTLYLNLLIGYAVSDIQLLKSKAEVLQLSNRLATIYNIESFLLSPIGQLILRSIAAMRCKKRAQLIVKGQPLDFLYVVPLGMFEERKTKEIKVKFEEIPEKMLKQLKEIAYNNLLNDTDE